MAYMRWVIDEHDFWVQVKVYDREFMEYPINLNDQILWIRVLLLLSGFAGQ